MSPEKENQHLGSFSETSDFREQITSIEKKKKEKELHSALFNRSALKLVILQWLFKHAKKYRNVSCYRKIKAATGRNTTSLC